MRDDALHRLYERPDLRRRLGLGRCKHGNDAVGDRVPALAVATAGGLRNLVETRLRTPHPRKIEIDTGLNQRSGDYAAGPTRFQVIADRGEDAAAVWRVVRWTTWASSAALDDLYISSACLRLLTMTSD